MKFSKTDFGYVVRLEPGEEIVSALSSFAQSRGFGSAALQGIGAAKDITLGYFEREKKSYVRRTLAGEYEVLSLAGNVSHFEKAPWVHVHALIAGPDFRVTGGHLFSGTVTVTIELALYVSAARVERQEDPATGFRGLALDESL
ncbi:MAG: DNA-binding protein [Candidatus Eisenbacteria bacterium]|nr:DNA-binding protein [Candidatus Eisenbacteria bacterium]